MVEEYDNIVIVDGQEEADDLSSMTKSGSNVESEAEEGEFVAGDSDGADKAKEAAVPKHLLEHSWTFWFDNPSAKAKQAAWGSSIRPIYTFSSVQDFWSVYNNVHHPSKLVVGSDFYCFKHKIEPKWEDPVCANGGKWTMSFPRFKSDTASFPRFKSDTAWLHTLLAMLGEQFDHGDLLCGVVVNVRAKQEKISLWTKNAANEAAQISIGKQWKELLDYNGTIGFILHDDAKRLDRGAKNSYTV